MKRFIAEFETQEFTQIIFPHAKSDWAEYLQEAQENFVNIINAIIKYQKCLVVCDNIEKVKSHFQEHKNLFFVEYETNDTWARDCSALCLENDEKVELLDFTFNAWGGKFEATKDNAMTQNLSYHYSQKVSKIEFVLEGGALESNGAGLVLTTTECMLNKNRNPDLTEPQITQKLKKTLGASEILYLRHGYLAGDDTDSHIDTLARFIDKETIMYVKCEDETDEHFDELSKMQEELKSLACGFNLKLIALPFPHAKYFEDQRLPATYANFLFVNGAVIVPTYDVEQDKEALEIFKNTFKELDVVGVDCSTLIKQHGSLHCVTMNFASGVGIFV